MVKVTTIQALWEKIESFIIKKYIVKVLTSMHGHLARHEKILKPVDHHIFIDLNYLPYNGVLINPLQQTGDLRQVWRKL